MSEQELLCLSALMDSGYQIGTKEAKGFAAASMGVPLNTVAVYMNRLSKRKAIKKTEDGIKEHDLLRPFDKLEVRILRK